MLDTQAVEHSAAVIVQLEQGAIAAAAVRGTIRIKPLHIALAQPRDLLDENRASGDRPDGLGKDLAVARVRLEMNAKDAMSGARRHTQREGKNERGAEQPPHGGLIKGLTVFATLASFSAMRLTFAFAALALFAATSVASAQEKRSWFSRMLHPSEKIPTYKNPKIRGLAVAVELPSEPVKLSEMRQLPVHVLLTNRGDKAVELHFPTEQRIEILLHNSTGRVVTRWSDNRAFEAKPGTLLINPGEHVEYSETIATRELEPGKVFAVQATVPAYPELDAQRKGIAAP